LTPQCLTQASTSFKSASVLVLLGALSLIVGVVGPAFAQGAAEMTPAERATLAGNRLSSVVEPTRTTTTSPQPIFTVEASTGDTQGTAAIGWLYGDFVLDAKVAGPLNKSTGEAQFADLDGLRGQATIDVGAHYLYWNPPDPAPTLIEACRKLADVLKVSLKDVDCTLSNLRAQQKKLGVPLAPDIDPGTVLLLGGRYKVGRKTFDYVNPATLDDASEAHTGWALAFGGAVITRNNILFGAGYRREVRFSDGSAPVDLCLPLGVGGATTCSADVILGAPRRGKANQFYGEVRKFFGAIALSPRITADFTSDVTGIDVPLYFLKNTSGGFTGGVRVGWRSDRKGLTVVGFVGQVLGILTVP
jgi:hypothetical protein